MRKLEQAVTEYSHNKVQSKDVFKPIQTGIGGGGGEFFPHGRLNFFLKHVIAPSVAAPCPPV